MTELKRDIAVVGGGLVGYAAAIGLAASGFDTVLVSPPAPEDRRSTALIGASVALLDRLGVLDRVRPLAEPLTTMRIVDDTGRLLRAPTVEFRAAEIGLSAFGLNALNADLHAALEARAAALEARLTLVRAAATDVEITAEHVVITLDDGRTIRAALAVGADGRRSLVRERAGITLRQWSYPQSALVLNFAHRLGHGGVSTEFHTAHGPFTQVPLPGRRSSLVWVDEPERAALHAELKPESLARLIEARMHSILGAVTVEEEEPVQAFALKGASARRLAAARVALVGEAAHVFPPIGAQGFNLGLRDVEALIGRVSSSRDDPGRAACVAAYEAERRGDVRSRTVGVDLLNRSLLAGFLPVQAGRAIGLAALSALPFVRRFAMREGVAPGAGLRGLPRRLRDGLGAGS